MLFKKLCTWKFCSHWEIAPVLGVLLQGQATRAKRWWRTLFQISVVNWHMGAWNGGPFTEVRATEVGEGRWLFLSLNVSFIVHLEFNHAMTNLVLWLDIVDKCCDFLFYVCCFVYAAQHGQSRQSQKGSRKTSLDIPRISWWTQCLVGWGRADPGRYSFDTVIMMFSPANLLLVHLANSYRPFKTES